MWLFQRFLVTKVKKFRWPKTRNLLKHHSHCIYYTERLLPSNGCSYHTFSFSAATTIDSITLEQEHRKEQLHSSPGDEVRSLLTGPALLELLQVACENVSLESFLEGRVPREPECWPVCLFTCFTISKSFLVHTDWCPGTVRTVGTSRTQERQLHGKPVPTAFAFSKLNRSVSVVKVYV